MAAFPAQGEAEQALGRHHVAVQDLLGVGERGGGDAVVLGRQTEGELEAGLPGSDDEDRGSCSGPWSDLSCEGQPGSGHS